MSMLQSAGRAFITSDGVVGASGVPVRIYMMHVISGGGGAAAVSLVNGTASGTANITETGTTSKGVTFTYGAGGAVFPAGCFVDIDTNTTSVMITYERMDA